ncbi:disease resistance-like protein DSC1 [Pistacia vera]|uniref:disease resistance-like protein DSC1 n=1 Tax=Pistacia vera TaxID=55513 RepID=UPI0012631F99|nr:disease resistance-like protein DSC1 [Pistacia vera]
MTTRDVPDPIRRDDPIVSPSPVEQLLAKRLADVEVVMRRILGMPIPTKKSRPNCYADSSFADEIALADMPQKFTIPNMKPYDGTTDPDDHIASYKQRMFTGSEAIECISLDISKIKEINLKCNAFLKMQNLRFLDFYCLNKLSRRVLWGMDEENVNKVHALQGLEFSSCNISFFRWFGYPLDSLPSNFELENLFALIMPWSKIKQLWNGLQHLEKLKHINPIHSKHLIRIPDLSLAPNLESLILESCTSLIEVHSSIQYLNKLVILNLKGCKSLNSLPINIQSKFLRYLILSGCSNLKKAPKITCNMENVYFDGTSITELPLIEYPSRLRCLDLENCSRLEILPSDICELKILCSLKLKGCSKLHNLPQQLGKLKSLCSLSLSGYRGQDPKVGSKWSLLSYLSFLYDLDLSDCKIMRLLDTLGKVYFLRILNLSGNNFEWMPSSFKKLKLKYLDISYCERLKCSPLGASTAETYNCISLELWDFYLSSSVRANFGKCLKLDQKLKANLGESLYGLPGAFLYPGNKIPEWFSFQNVGSTITLEVPPLSHCELFSVIEVCLVVTSQDHEKAPQSLVFHYKVIGIDENESFVSGGRLGWISLLVGILQCGGVFELIVDGQAS